MKPYGTSEALSDMMFLQTVFKRLTFVFTGLLVNLNQDYAEDILKILDGRVTKSRFI